MSEPSPAPPLLSYATPTPPAPHIPQNGDTHFNRSLGLPTALAVNMTQICGIGPFITIPLMVSTMGGPQAILGWIIGALLAMTDGLVWAELGAAMPHAGGTYLYLREAFQYRTGRLMPFLFVWTAMIYIPLTMSTGVIGMVQYLGYYFPVLAGNPKIASPDWFRIHLLSLAIVVIGGLLSSLVLTLFIVPIMYRWIAPKELKEETKLASDEPRKPTPGTGHPEPA